MSKFYTKIKYLFVLPCLLLFFSEVSSQNLLTNSCFEAGTVGAGNAPTDWNHPSVNTTDSSDSLLFDKIYKKSQEIDLQCKNIISLLSLAKKP